MSLAQMTLTKLKGMILRLWPGLAGYHTIRYAKITRVYQEAGRDLADTPGMAVDLHFVTHDFSKDNAFSEFTRIRLAGPSEFVQAPPSTGTYVLIHFPFWLSSTATVLSVLYLDKHVAPEEETYQIRGAKKTQISAEEELSLGEADDRAVLGNELISALIEICDQIIELGKLGNMGVALGNQGAVTAKLEQLKQTLPDSILSDIKIGRGSDVQS